MLSALDLATRRTGWCAGGGDQLPEVGTWEFGQTGDDLGRLLDNLDQALAAHVDRFRPSALVYEAPILVVNDRNRGTDRLLTIRKIYSMGGHVEFFCRRRGIDCAEVDLRKIKKELAGFVRAGKAEMVAAAEKIGVSLPPGKSAEDAADAFGAWLLLLRQTSPQLSARFDKALWGHRGALF